jgi:hypothetical protein
LWYVTRLQLTKAQLEQPVDANDSTPPVSRLANHALTDVFMPYNPAEVTTALYILVGFKRQARWLPRYESQVHASIYHIVCLSGLIHSG